MHRCVEVGTRTLKRKKLRRGCDFTTFFARFAFNYPKIRIPVDFAQRQTLRGFFISSGEYLAPWGWAEEET